MLEGIEKWRGAYYWDNFAIYLGEEWVVGFSHDNLTRGHRSTGLVTIQGLHLSDSEAVRTRHSTKYSRYSKVGHLVLHVNSIAI